MRKLLIMLGVAVILILPISSFDTSAEEFEVVWRVDIPRDVYFIGETVSVTITAYASTDSYLFIPGEMSMVTIRNESLSEMYSAWITTDSNGTALIQWDIPLEADTGNYTFILAPIAQENLIFNFAVLYDENTYWQKRVENLEDELASQYEYLNYLYATSNYLKRQVQILKNQVFIAGAVMFITIMITLAVVFPIWAQRSNLPDMRNTMSSKLAKLMGFSSTPKILLTDQHEELAQQTTPKDRKPARYGMIYHCKICDPDKKEPMTRFSYDIHLDSHNHKQFSFRKRRFNKVYKELLSEHYKTEELKPDVEKEVLLEHRKNELIDSVELSRKELKAIEAERKQAEESLKVEKKETGKIGRLFKRKKPVEEIKKEEQKTEVLKETPSPKPVSQRKVRAVKPQSGNPIAEQFDLVDKPIKKTTPIDDLFERLSKEKVN